MLFKFKLSFVCLLLVFYCLTLINASKYSYNKPTPKPTTPKPKPTTAKPKPTTPKPKPTTAKPKPTTPKPKPTTTKPKPTKPSYYPPATTKKPVTTAAPKPEPYKFEYEANVGSPDPTGKISQSESGDTNGVVTGTYALIDPDGRERTVHYRADKTGFHATVETNELPADVENPADVVIIGSGPLPSSDGSSAAPSGSTGGYDYGDYGTSEAPTEGPTPGPTEGPTDGYAGGGYY